MTGMASGTTASRPAQHDQQATAHIVPRGVLSGEGALLGVEGAPGPPRPNIEVVAGNCVGVDRGSTPAHSCCWKEPLHPDQAVRASQSSAATSTRNTPRW